MGQIIQNVTSFMGDGTPLVILKLAGMVFGFLAIVGLGWWLKKQAIAQARTEEQNKQVQDRQKIITDNKTENQQAKTDSQAADDFLKK